MKLVLAATVAVSLLALLSLLALRKLATATEVKAPRRSYFLVSNGCGVAQVGPFTGATACDNARKHVEGDFRNASVCYSAQ
jgi:hypothetical protein